MAAEYHLLGPSGQVLKNGIFGNWLRRAEPLLFLDSGVPAQQVTKRICLAWCKCSLGDDAENQGSMEEHEDFVGLQIPHDAAPFHLRIYGRRREMDAVFRDIGCEIVLISLICSVAFLKISAQRETAIHKVDPHHAEQTCK